jgi:hypothetical protein
MARASGAQDITIDDDVAASTTLPALPHPHTTSTTFTNREIP